MQTARFVIEVPRGGLVKWGADGHIDFVSLVPCPFNYGSIPDRIGADGDPLDVVVLGPRIPRGGTGELPIRACARFVDRGIPDDKWVCAAAPLRRRDRMLLRAFFQAYAIPKDIKSTLQDGKRSYFSGLEEKSLSFHSTIR